MDRPLIEGLMEVVVPAVREYVDGALSKATAPLLARIAEIESREPLKGDPGKSVTIDEVRPLIEEAVKALPPAPPGKSITVEDVRPMLEEMVAALPAPKDGKSVSLEDVLPAIAEAVAALPPAEPGKSVTIDDVRPVLEELVAALPRPQDGKSVTLDDVRPILNEAIDAVVPQAIERAVSVLPRLAGTVIDNNGDLVNTYSDGSTKVLGRVVGKDADRDEIARVIADEVAKFPRPKDGKDGVGFDDLSVVYDGERKFTLRFERGDQVKEFAFDLAFPIDRGVWKEGQFAKGDGVTWNGSFFIAQRETSTKPETPNSDWRLSTKRGRDGGSAYDVARRGGFKGTEQEWLASLKGEPGKPGRPGKDAYS